MLETLDQVVEEIRRRAFDKVMEECLALPDLVIDQIWEFAKPPDFLYGLVSLDGFRDSTDDLVLGDFLASLQDEWHL